MQLPRRLEECEIGQRSTGKSTKKSTGKDVQKSTGKKLGKAARKIVELMRENPQITINYKYPTHETKIDNYITKSNCGYCKL